MLEIIIKLLGWYAISKILIGYVLSAARLDG